MIRLVDCRQDGHEHVTGAYVVETDEGPALFDCGASAMVPALKEGLAAHGLELREIGNLLLSHVHLDHAGAAGALVREHPGLRVWVARVGAQHVIDPSRLERSARRLFGEDFDRLWGAVVPVPEENVRIVGERVLGLRCFPTPGHAVHHVSYLDADGVLYNGDSAGVRVQPARFVLPAAPPPDVDLEAWAATIDAMAGCRPERLALVHYGVVDDPAEHLQRLREQLALWAGRVRDGMEHDAFVEQAHADLTESDGEEWIPRYERPAPASYSFHGLRRYWDTR